MSDLDLGRRRAAAAARPRGRGALGERIVLVATDLFLGQGFGATSIEAVAAAAGVSKRTFYHRFRDKPDLFRAVVRRLIARWATPYEAELAVVAEQAEPIEEALLKTARRILAAALSPEALQLYRLLIAEAPRFPELAHIITEQSAGAGRRLGQFLAGEGRRTARARRCGLRRRAVHQHGSGRPAPPRAGLGAGDEASRARALAPPQRHPVPHRLRRLGRDRLGWKRRRRTHADSIAMDQTLEKLLAQRSQRMRKDAEGKLSLASSAKPPRPLR